MEMCLFGTTLFGDRKPEAQIEGVPSPTATDFPYTVPKRAHLQGIEHGHSIIKFLIQNNRWIVLTIDALVRVMRTVGCGERK